MTAHDNVGYICNQGAVKYFICRGIEVWSTQTIVTQFIAMSCYYFVAG